MRLSSRPFPTRRGAAGVFRNDRRGSAAVEFAIILPVFLALVFSIVEAGWFFFVKSAVEQANANAARLIRTGQAQTGGVTKEQFFDKICNVLDTFGDCSKRLTVDIERFDDFKSLAADLSEPVCRDAGDDKVSALPYDAGAQRDIVRVRVCFLYKPVNPMLGLNLARTKDGMRKIVSVSIFRNEPYGG